MAKIKKSLKAEQRRRRIRIGLLNELLNDLYEKKGVINEAVLTEKIQHEIFGADDYDGDVDFITPTVLALMLNVDPKRVRNKLRMLYPGHAKGTGWNLSPEMVDAVRLSLQP